MMEELKKYKLGEICKITSSKRIFEKEYVDGGIPFIRGQEISDGSIANPSSEFLCYISPERYEELKKNYGVPKKNDILITAVGTIGNTYLVEDNKKFYFKDGNIIWFKNIKKEVYPLYLLFFMKSPFFNQQIEYSLIGAVQKALTIVMLSKIEISLPSLATQRKIATVLSNIDRKISVNREINRNLEELAKQIYDYWFVQFDFPNEDGKPYKSSGGKMVWDELLKREIPAGWEAGILSDIAYITMGQSPDGSSYNETGVGIIFYQGSTDFGIRFPTIRVYTTSPKRFAKKGDILMSVRAPVGILNIANHDCCIGRGLAALKSKVASMVHLWFTMEVFKQRFEGKNLSGTTFGAITKDELFSLPVVVPPKELLLMFNKKTLSIFNNQLSIGAEIDKLTSLRNTLLPLLMNGQVTLNSCFSEQSISGKRLQNLLQI
mgnify:CR=1 FL=1